MIDPAPLTGRAEYARAYGTLRLVTFVHIVHIVHKPCCTCAMHPPAPSSPASRLLIVCACAAQPLQSFSLVLITWVLAVQTLRTDVATAFTSTVTDGRVISILALSAGALWAARVLKQRTGIDTRHVDETLSLTWTAAAFVTFACIVTPVALAQIAVTNEPLNVTLIEILGDTRLAALVGILFLAAVGIHWLSVRRNGALESEAIAA